MPEKSTMQEAKEDLREGKSPSTAADGFVQQEIEHLREGKHGACSPQQAIATGSSKARRAVIPLKPPRRGQASESTRTRAEGAVAAGPRPAVSLAVGAADIAANAVGRDSVQSRNFGRAVLGKGQELTGVAE